jgi:DNA-binding Lrp family transcriptional regulator
MNTSILQFLRTNGEQLDADIAKALHMTKPQVLNHIAELSTKGEVICCRVTRFFGGKKVEGVSCRLSAYVPPKATGPKPGAKRGAAANAANNVEAYVA